MSEHQEVRNMLAFQTLLRMYKMNDPNQNIWNQLRMNEQLSVRL